MKSERRKANRQMLLALVPFLTCHCVALAQSKPAEPAAPPLKAQVPPKERIEFNKLLAINPNYFGNLESSGFEPVNKIVGNTTYEKVTCVGFNPALNLLEATIQINLPVGYNGDLCKAGSTEYVRFFVDYGAGWIDAGLAAFNTHDIPNMVDCEKQPDKPLSYVVTQPLDPRQKNCRDPVLPKVRAILSWQLVPMAGNPNWPPVWGNVLEEHIQIKPRRTWFSDIFELIPKEALKKLPPMIFEEVNPLPIPLPDPSPLSLGDLAGLYSVKEKGKSAQVEPHRFGLAHIQSLLTSGNQDTLSSAAAEWKAAGLDLAGAIAALDQTKADVSYEELHCLGLEYNLDRLVATFNIKKPLGYSGELCGPGSQEYVAFWADWNDTCEWTYLNTVAVNVHDIMKRPFDELSYSAILPVDLSAVRRPCGKPKIARIRAVLSWNTLPSTSDPDKLNHWGNRLDAHVQIRPGYPVPGDTPTIFGIGGIFLDDINVFGNGMTTTDARFSVSGVYADDATPRRECPFGGYIIVKGSPVPGRKYRLLARKSGDSSDGEPVKNPFWVQPFFGFGFGSLISPDSSTGYVNYMVWTDNTESVLARWTPSGDELKEIRLEMATLGGVVVGYTPWYKIQLDNTAPRRKPALPPFEPPGEPPVTCEIHIDTGDCKPLPSGTLIKGHFVARDEHFGGFTLRTLPSSTSPNSPTTALASTSETASFLSGGTEWQLDTAKPNKMAPCGYVVLLQVSDRSILDSDHGHHNYNEYDVGFCLGQ
jgi:hypothetical protein